MGDEAKTRAWLVLLVSLVGLAACRVQHDNPPRPLNAQYHELPQVIVDRLLKEVPRPPDGSEIYCRDDDMGDYYSPYCVCYSAQSCRELAASDRCDAKIGEVRPGVGVCRERIERVVIG
jgi:hypothetical protein